MGILLFEKVTQEIENSKFDCGVESINEYVRKSYYPSITQQAYAYSVISSGKILGYCQIMFKEIELSYFPENISEYYDSNVKEEKLSAVHIRYIAVDKMFQKNKIGTNILKAIVNSVKDLTAIWPIRVITLDARINLVDWYTKQGFLKMVKNVPGQDIATVAMYFDCMKYYTELNEYINCYMI